MKTSLLCIAALYAAPLFTTHINAQSTSSLPAPSAAPNKRTQEVKEKAEDEFLLQQLDADQAPVRAEGRGKGQAGWGAVPRGGAITTGPAGLQYRVSRAGSSPKALIVRSTESDSKAQAALEEDLAVMSHLLNKSLEELPGGAGNPNRVMGIDVFFAPGTAPLRSLYLENYGALFFLNVNFPLVAPPERPTEEKPVGDSAWDEARQELYGQHFQGPDGGGEDYNQEKVDRLKDTILDCLKNATNIRGLAAEEYVTVWICGGTSSITTKVRSAKKDPGAPGNNFLIADQMAAGRRTVLTLRARKSDIDACAKGKLSPDEFRKHVRLLAYTADPAAPANELLQVGTFSTARVK